MQEMEHQSTGLENEDEDEKDEKGDCFSNFVMWGRNRSFWLLPRPLVLSDQSQNMH